MTLDTRLEKITLAFALVLPCAASLMLMSFAPGAVSATTYAVVVALLLGTATVALNTWKSAQPTPSVGQLLYETNTGAPIVMHASSATRIVTMLALSAVTTTAIVAVWLS
jgi:hypothetical protein